MGRARWPWWHLTVWAVVAMVVVHGVAARPAAHGQAAATVRAADPVFEASIDDLQHALERKEITSRQLVERYLARIDAYDQAGPALNTIITINPRAREIAAALDHERAAGRTRGPLHGIPIVIKDNYDTADMPTTGGSIALASSRPLRDAFQVTRLKDAGAIILAKTNLHELAAGIVTVSSLGGWTRNPYDVSRNPGGSSGGTGAAVAANFAAAGMGTDTCGSIRIPSAHNNLTGLRPTRGLSSRSGVIPLSHTQDVAGPMAKSVRDVARLLDATVGADPDDATTRASEGRIPRSYVDALMPGALAGARVGVLTALFGAMPEDEEVARVVRAAVARMVEAGAVAVDLEVPNLADLMRSTSVIDAEFKFDLADYLAARPAAPVKSLGEILDRGLYHADLDASFRRRNAIPARDTETYRASLARQRELGDAVLAAMDRQKVSFLVYPPIRRKAGPIGVAQPGGNNCQLSASTGFPALAVPAGFTADGLPVGLELLGRPFSEPDLLAAGYALEQQSPMRHAPASTPALARGAATRRNPPQTRGSSSSASSAKVSITGRFTWNASTREFGYQVAMTGATSEVILLALHRGGASGTGPIVASLTRTGARTMRGKVLLRESDKDAVESGLGYVEIYTRGQPLGAGQVKVRIR